MSETSVPKTKEEVVDFAQKIQDNLLNKYEEDGGKFIDEKYSQTGILYRCMGSLGLLYPAIAIDELELNDEVVEIIIKEFEEVLESKAKDGFNITPYWKEKYFSPDSEDQHDYIDSVAWVLSLSVYLRYADRSGLLKLSNSRKDKVKNTIKECLEIIMDAACEAGGWGFTNDNENPSIYYSWSVIESLSDVADYILGESKYDLGIEKDTELVDFLETDDLVKLIEEKREDAIKWLAKEYMDELSNLKIDFDPTSQEKNTLGYNSLYYRFYILIMSVLGYMDTIMPDEEEIKSEFESALYISRIEFENARKDKKWFDDPSSELKLKNEMADYKNTSIYKRAAKNRLTDPSLIPISLRANILYTYYISKGEDSKIEDLFQILFQQRGDEGLWDDVDYSLPVTERAIEGIVDYYDYVKNLRQRGITQSVNLQKTETDEPMKTLDELVDRKIEEKINSCHQIKKSKEEKSQHSPDCEIAPEAILESFTHILTEFNLSTTTNNEFKWGDGKKNFLTEEVVRFIKAVLIEELVVDNDEVTVQEMTEIVNDEYDNMITRLSNFLTLETRDSLEELFNAILDFTSRKGA